MTTVRNLFLQSLSDSFVLFYRVAKISASQKGEKEKKHFMVLRKMKRNRFEIPMCTLYMYVVFIAFYYVPFSS